MRFIIQLTILVSTFVVCNFQIGFALQQSVVEINKKSDSLIINKSVFDTLAASNFIKSDSVLLLYNSDSIIISKDSPDSIIHYSSKDSLIFSAPNNSVILYNESKIKYKDLDLESYQIQINWDEHLLRAQGKKDSIHNKTIGAPIFKESDKTYNAQRIIYNYESQKGKIFDLVTTESEGFIHSEAIKKSGDKDYLGYQSVFTTCDEEHPHFGFRAKHIKVIPDKLIVTGPAQLIVENIPTPLFIPFAIFPIKKGQSSGLLIPQFNNDINKGLGLQNGGYYFGLGKHHDLALTGDIFSHGSYAIRANSNYNYRYKANGNFILTFANTRLGDPQESGFLKQKDFHITWRHTKDAKSNPYNLFSASVDAGTSRYNKNNLYDANQYLTSTYNSSISYQRIFPNKPFNLTINANHSQNNQTHDITFTLPNINFNINRITPFNKKNSIGEKRWYENIGFSYSANALNQLTTKDTLLFQSKFSDFKNGIVHSIPISTNIKVLKYFVLNPSVSYNERWFAYSSMQSLDTNLNIIHTRVNGFKTERDFTTSVSLNTRIFGMKQFHNSKIKAIRHVITPNISAQYHPDFGGKFWNYYKPSPKYGATPYSIFEQSIIGQPPAAGKFAGIGIGVTNDVEMKIFDAKDTVNQSRKIILLRSLAFNTFYNFAADSFKLSPISMSTNTGFLKNKITLNLNLQLNPYVHHEGRAIDKFALVTNGKIGKIKSANFAINANFASKESIHEFAKKTKNSNHSASKTDEQKQDEPINVNFNKWHIPFTFSTNYMLTVQPQVINFKDTVIYTQSVNGNLIFGLTPKWNISLNTGYDFRLKNLAYTDIVVLRDLHCWQLRIQVAPGRFYAIQINAKANILNDMELKKRKYYGAYSQF
ncbi:MAG: hypothetical protein RIQ33_581 [Bacteroidota bacterium]|jgi:hypothetical protein